MSAPKPSGRSLYQDAWRRIRRDPLAITCLVIILFYTAIAVLCEAGLLFADYDAPIGDRFEMKSLPPMTDVYAREMRADEARSLPPGVKPHRQEVDGKEITYRLFPGRHAAVRHHFERVPAAKDIDLDAGAGSARSAWRLLDEEVASFILSRPKARRDEILAAGPLVWRELTARGLPVDFDQLQDADTTLEALAAEGYGLDASDLGELSEDAGAPFGEIPEWARGWIQTRDRELRGLLLRGGPPVWRAIAACGVVGEEDGARGGGEPAPGGALELPEGVDSLWRRAIAESLVARPVALQRWLEDRATRTSALILPGGLEELAGLTIADVDLPDERLSEAGYWIVHRFWGGSDKAGRDALQLVTQGTKISMKVGLIASLIAIPIGLILGAVAGYFGGRIDDLIVWIYTTLACVPGLLLILAIAWAIGGGLQAIYIALGATTWVNLCRLIRGEFLKLREQDFVVAATALGVGSRRIILRHMVPNVMHLVIITFSLRFVYSILAEVVLSYIGVGVDVSQPSWGRLIQDTQEDFATRGVYWIFSLTTIAMFFIVLALNLFGDALRDALDPKLKR